MYGLVYIFDETTDISKKMEETYLNETPYYIFKSDTVEEMKTIWNGSMGKTRDFKKIKENYSTCITLTRCLIEF